jgi:hypothetical protein
MKLSSIFLILLITPMWTNAQDTATDSCLDSETLTKLGFTGAALEKVSEPTFCTDVYADPGRCITANTYEAAVNKYQDEFTTHNMGYGTLVEMFDTFFGNIGESLSNLWDKVSGGSEEKTWKEKMAEEVKKAQDAHDECFMGYNQVMMGVSCLLTSGKAKQLAEVNGETIKITATKTMLDVVETCMPVISAVCLYFKGGEEATDLTTPQTDDQKALCALHNTYEKCKSDGGNDTTCLDDSVRESFFEKMYQPYKNIWFPKVADVQGVTDKLLAWFDSAKDKVFSWFGSTKDSTTENSTDSNSTNDNTTTNTNDNTTTNTNDNTTTNTNDNTTTNTDSTRILESTMTINFKIDTEGADLWAMGSKSGVTRKFTEIFSFGIMSMLVGFLLK